MSESLTSAARLPANPLGKIRRPAATLLILVSAAAWAALVAALHGHVTRTPIGEEPAIGTHLALGHGFRSPVDPSRQAPPTMWSPPLYPVVIGLLYHLFDVASPAALWRLMFFNALCFGAFVAAMDRLACACLPRGVGMLTVVLLCLHPQFLHFVEDDWDTYLGLALFAWAMVIADAPDAFLGGIRRGAQRPGGSAALPFGSRLNRTALRCILLGVALAVTSLANAAMVLAYPMIVPRLTRRGVGMFITVAAFVLALLPWTLYLHCTVGGWHYVRGSAQSSLWVGNLPNSTGWADPQTMRQIPYFNHDEAMLMLRVGEAEYDRTCQRRFMENVRAAPMQFGLRCLRRIGYLLIGSPSAPSNYPLLPNWRIQQIYWPKTVLNSIVAALGLAGMVLVWRKYPAARWLIAAMILGEVAYVPAVILDRYTLLLRALMLMMTAVLVVDGWERSRKKAHG